ncbi:HEAT repeat domain-containing protein [Rhizobium sp. BT-175]|uniref:HEAT repeat domain-containing protein n=1 Tax=Rhizobium sp. BT-175 TaxID=2986929 RepID=UPI002235B702|nr:HEAT repeat domain-containing protein [Rhizobium sp. BT-175]MCV9945134.1 hypothetical protein [Rhizobium sp. BT-175]
MDIEAYKRQYLDEIASSSSASPKAMTGKAIDAYLSGPSPETETACEMVALLPLEGDALDDTVRKLLAMLGDQSLETPVRLAAFRQLGAAAFQPVQFAPFHADYIDLLRRLALDGDKQIRAAALEQLAMTGDAEAQKLLREGLEKTRKPLISDAKAVQLLAADDHSGALPIFRELAVSAKGKTREQALRALASDEQSVSLFREIATNKDEAAPLREIAVVNLKGTAPESFAELAPQVALDPGNSDRLRAAAVSALAHARNTGQAFSQPFHQQLDVLRSETQSRALKSSIRRFNKASRSE